MISVTVTKLPCICSEQLDGTINCNDLCISGEDITDSMIETEAVARSRGRAEIYSKYSDRMSISGNMPLTDYIKAGKVALYTDMEKGDYISLITRSAISIKRTDNSYTANLNLELEREI